MNEKIKAKILVADNNRVDSWFFQHYLTQKGYEVKTTLLPQFVTTLKACYPNLVLLSAQFVRAYGPQGLARLQDIAGKTLIVLLVSAKEMQSVRVARRFGLFDYLLKPYNMEEVESVFRRASEIIRVKRRVETDANHRTDHFGFHHLIGDSPAFTEVIGLAKKVARSATSTVLLQGESGTGKDVLAKAIHFESARYRNPFVEITCSALPEALLESELFGHERGSFTDAKGRKEGLFLLAHSGTVFLNEIGDMSLALQAKILRLIEQKMLRMVGGTKDIEVDVRIVAATCVDLQQAVDKGAFRLDLYYRLNVVPITLPPLRERTQDIVSLAQYFLGEYNQKFHRAVLGFSPQAEECLRRYHWPGNVRELRNVVERLLILEEEAETLGVEHLPANIKGEVTARTQEPQGTMRSEVGTSLAVAEEQLIKQTLEKCNHNLSKAARMLDIGRDALRYRVKKLGLMQG